MRTPLAVLGLTAALALAGATTAVAAPPAADAPNPAERGRVCHVTGSETNPVVEIYVPAHSQAPRRSCDVQQPEWSF